MNNKVVSSNRYIEVEDYQSAPFKMLLDDIHDFMKVPKKKKESCERCRGRSLLEPAVFESYKHWDNPWAILNADLKKDMTVLDCGSGRGVLQFYLASKGMDVHSIDVRDCRSKICNKIKKVLNKFGIWLNDPYDKVHSKLNRKYGVRVQFKRESAEDLSFPDDHFDRVFCISVIEHMEDVVIEKSIQEIERVLKPGGILLLTFDYHPEEDNTIIGFTGDDFFVKVDGKTNLKIINNEPEFEIEDWNRYIAGVNKHFRTANPNTSYGVVFKKNE